MQRLMHSSIATVAHSEGTPRRRVKYDDISRECPIIRRMAPHLTRFHESPRAWPNPAPGGLAPVARCYFLESQGQSSPTRKQHGRPCRQKGKDRSRALPSRQLFDSVDGLSFLPLRCYTRRHCCHRRHTIDKPVASSVTSENCFVLHEVARIASDSYFSANTTAAHSLRRGQILDGSRGRTSHGCLDLPCLCLTHYK